ncbi:hypothetical protein JCGZ_25098 [Jatropha curcas]|uniref:Uncharacterized protein n=1 Tax=Jatropha curcas TaxID=180498 RepID=A0A067JYA9_JATCU|nr:hypothetical protein JCGZ_25098 [Jatropha curcas]
MGLSKSSLLFFLLLLTISLSRNPRFTEARTLSFLSEQSHSKIFATLGIVCKCCDGSKGECSSTWKTGSCNKLQCLPWKFG